MTERAQGRPGRRAAAMLVAALLTLGATGCGWLRRPAPEPAGPSAALQRQFAEAESRLRSPDPVVRRQAALMLLTMDHPDAFDVALDNMRNAQNPAVRASVIEAVGFRADERAFPAVLAAIGDEDPDVQEAAASALARFTGPDQVEAMTDLVGRRDVTSHQKELLFTALGRGLAVQAVPVLLNALEQTDGAARVAAWEALRRISRRQLPPEAEQWRQWWRIATHRSRESVLEEHLRALAHDLQARTEELNELRDEQAELMKLVGSTESETPRALLEALASRHDSVRHYASSRLAALGKENLNGLKLETRDRQVLRQALAEQSVQVRRNVIRFAVQLGADYRDELVALALADEDPAVLTTAIDGVRGGADQAVLDRLGELLGSSPHPKVREAAANALGKVGSAASVPVLVKALDDTEENVRWFAVEGLRKLGATQAVPVISEMLRRDPSARVREIAASALGELGQPAGVPALRAALDDANERVQQKAVAALQALATDNYERMTVIADTLREHGLLEPAQRVLERIIEQHREAEGMDARVAATYRKLAAVQKEAQDFAGAAMTYEELDAASGGSPEVRRELVDCWLKAGEPQRVVGAVEKWLGAAAPAENAGRVDFALSVAELLITSGHVQQGGTVLDLVQTAAGEAVPQDVVARIQELRGRIGG